MMISAPSLSEYKIDNSPSPAQTKRASLISEFRSVFQPLRLLTQYPNLSKIEKGNVNRVLLIPGWKSHETVMFPIKTYLSRLGYTPEYWGLGFNNGAVEKYRDQLIERLSKEDADEKVCLVGWSLGGTVAREIARELPEKVACVVTYGTPVIGGPKYTIGKNYYSKEIVQEIQDKLADLDATNPIQVPISAIFTKNDSIVSWAACLDHTSKKVRHYEVNSSHLSLGIDPAVWRIVAMQLGEV